MSAKRSPKTPIETHSMRSPGESVLTTAASIAPVPADVSVRTSFFVSKSDWSPLVMRAIISANSGPRWLIIWRDMACRTSSGQGVGPGMRRFTGTGGSFRVRPRAPSRRDCACPHIVSRMIGERQVTGKDRTPQQHAKGAARRPSRAPPSADSTVGAADGVVDALRAVGERPDDRPAEREDRRDHHDDDDEPEDQPVFRERLPALVAGADGMAQRPGHQPPYPTPEP